MKPMLFGCLFMLALLTTLAPDFAQAAESYDNCAGMISSLPAVISTQGTWCLTSDLTTAITSGSAITVNTNNVTIDCNNFKLGGLTAGVGTTASGLSATNRINVTVRHCNVRGFLRGLYFTGSGGGHTVENNNFDGNTQVGIHVEGDASIVRNNRVSDTGGSTVYSQVRGIEVLNSIDVINNMVSGATARSGSNGNVYGIYAYADSARINGNEVTGLVKDGTGAVYGIYAEYNEHTIIRNNDLIGDGYPTSVGIYCTYGSAVALDNVLFAFATNISSCYDAGNVARP